MVITLTNFSERNLCADESHHAMVTSSLYHDVNYFCSAKQNNSNNSNIQKHPVLNRILT